MIIPGHILPLNIVEPFEHKQICNGMSFGVSHAGYDIRIKQDVILWPNLCRLASTIEKFNMPEDVVGVVHDKSSWARKGVAVQNTVLEPGWTGYLTLEITNHTWWPIRIKAGSPIAQIIFHRTEGRCIAYSGKYQNQADKPIAAIDEVAAT